MSGLQATNAAPNTQARTILFMKMTPRKRAARRSARKIGRGNSLPSPKAKQRKRLNGPRASKAPNAAENQAGLLSANQAEHWAPQEEMPSIELKLRLKEEGMLLVLALILLLVWIVGLAVKVTAWFIHLAIVAAVILLILHFVRGRGAGTPAI
jgi:hypothetical protein